MSKYKNLRIPGKQSDLITKLNEIKAKDYRDFIYDVVRTRVYSEGINEHNPIECTAVFVSILENIPVSLVWILIKNNELYITNITPSKPGSITTEQYNSILESFELNVIKNQ